MSHKAFRASFTLAAAGYIGPADAAPGRHLPLGQGLALVESVPQGDDHGLPWVQTLFDAPAHPYTGILGVQFLQHIVIHTDGIHEGKGIAVSVAVDGVGQRDLPLSLALCPEMHQDFVFDAPGGVGSKPYLFVRFKGTDPLDQSYGADGDQVVLVSVGGIVFFKGLLQRTNPPR